MQIIAKGQLQHHFWGDYRATIVLLFALDYLAQRALAKLPGFEPHPGDKKALVYHGGGADLKAVEALLVGYGANHKKLTSLAKSIDYGEPFTITVDLTPEATGPQPEQQRLLGLENERDRGARFEAQQNAGLDY